MASDFFDPELLARQRARMERYRAAAANVLAREMPTPENLWYFDKRTDVGDWLREHGWDVSTATAPELMARHGRRPAGDVAEDTPRTLFVAAEKR
ncbi:MAG: hypothetical protein JO152_10075 [Mycobacteriaceae bacterium]|nr:hypothetical protein [Mycobacteriaceae bacterium]